MTPRFKLHDSHNGDVRNVVTSCDGPESITTTPFLPDGIHGCVIKLRPAMIYPSGHSPRMYGCSDSSFVGAVLHIIKVCSEPKMLRVAALWIISVRAVVQYAKAMWDRTSMNNPRDSMRSLRTLAYAAFAIPTIQLAGRPFPAFSRFSLHDLLPKLSQVFFRKLDRFRQIEEVVARGDVFSRHIVFSGGRPLLGGGFRVPKVQNPSHK